MDPLGAVLLHDNGAENSKIAGRQRLTPKRDICPAKSLPLTLLLSSEEAEEVVKAMEVAGTGEDVGRAASAGCGSGALLDTQKEDLRQRRRRQLKYNHQVTMDLDLGRSVGHR